MTPTVVLVQGAFAESSSWNDVAERLVDEGHRVIAYGNPLRSVAGDAAGLTELVRTIGGPIVLAGHSYGGAVMTNVTGRRRRGSSALVYIAAFALEAGESCRQRLRVPCPAATLGRDAPACPAPGGGIDLYIRQDAYHEQFCADVPGAAGAADGDHAAAGRRGGALGEGSGDAPLWKTVPSWFIFGELDHNIPAGAHREHGRAGRCEGHRGDRRRLARRRDLAPRRRPPS